MGALSGATGTTGMTGTTRTAGRDEDYKRRRGESVWVKSWYVCITGTSICNLSLSLLKREIYSEMTFVCPPMMQLIRWHAAD